MKPFTARDVQRAHDHLRPHVQKLVDGFGQAQAFESVMSVAFATSPNRPELPKYMQVGPLPRKAAN
jgi:hypothetical protein